MKLTSIFAVAMTTTFLAACGGGGGDSVANVTAPVASTTTFPLQSSYQTLAASGYNKSFTIGGSCTGSGTRTSSPATTPATFEGVAGLSAVSTLTINYTNCTPASSASTSTTYFDTNYIPRGLNSAGSNYGVTLQPLVFPAAVTVGSTGIIGTLTLYTNSTKSTPNGRIDLSYVVETDGNATASAIVNLILKTYNASGTLTATEQDRYRITATGPLNPIAIDIQYANGSTARLIGTYQ